MDVLYHITTIRCANARLRPEQEMERRLAWPKISADVYIISPRWTGKREQGMYCAACAAPAPLPAPPTLTTLQGQRGRWPAFQASTLPPPIEHYGLLDGVDQALAQVVPQLLIGTTRVPDAAQVLAVARANIIRGFR